MFTENLHLEQERTKFIYQDRHKLIVLFPPFFPRLARASNTTIWGLEVDAGDDASVVRRRGAGSNLAQSCCIITESGSFARPPTILGSPWLVHYLGSPTRSVLRNMSRSSAGGRRLDVAKIVTGSAASRGTRNVSRRWGGSTAVHRTVVIAGKISSY